MVTAAGAAVLGSIAVLVHATLCAIQHREYLKAIDEDFSYPPFEIAAQCCFALAIGTWGVLQLQGKFLPIRTTEVLGQQTIDSLHPGPSLMHFNHRELRGWSPKRER